MGVYLCSQGMRMSADGMAWLWVAYRPYHASSSGLRADIADMGRYKPADPESPHSKKSLLYALWLTKNISVGVV